MVNLRKAAVTAAAFILVGGSVPFRHLADVAPSPRFEGNLSVLTYNVKGLPWPVATGRAADLVVIGERLRVLRLRGAAHVVVLQEAFTEDARGIGRAAGYRYRVGAGSNAGEGKFVGSGLEVLSDYPLTQVHRLVFGDSACAGYDCLADKGALSVRIAVPGVAAPVLMVTTHLNSRKASGAPVARADRAYAEQAEALGDFLSSVRGPSDPLIVAGDFNVGRSRFRGTVLAEMLDVQGGHGSDVKDALLDAVRRGMALTEDTTMARSRGKDHQFFVSGSATRLDLTGIAVPFGHDRDGTMLSDHVGWTAYYRVATT